MTLWNRALQADFVNFTTLDNIIGLIWDGILKLNRDYDPFGAVYSGWTTLTGTQILSVWPGVGTGTITESGNVLNFNDGGNAANAIGARRNVSYLDANIVFYWSATRAGITGVGNAAIFFDLWRSQNNYVQLGYDSINIAGNHKVAAYKWINGAATLLAASVDLGVQYEMWFRITRVAATQTFTIYYAIADPIATPANWVQLYSGVVNDAVHFNNTHVLYPIAAIYNNDPTHGWSYDPDVDFYDQIAGSYNRYIENSPEYNVIDSTAGAIEYVANMGINKIFKGSGFSATTADPVGSSNKWKLGYGDAIDRASATFDTAFRDEAALDVLVAAGAFDNHQYLFLKGQQNSDGTVQPTLTDITISGTAIGLVPDHTIQQVEIIIKPKQIEISKPSKRVEISKSSKLIEVPWDA